MDATEKIKYLTEQIDSSVNSLRLKKKRNKRKSSLIKVGIIALTGIATILLGLDVLGFEKEFKKTAFILTSIATILTALEPFFNYRALWIECEDALAKLYRLKSTFEYYVHGTENQEIEMGQIDRFFEEYLKVWENLGTNWIAFRKQNK